jgi:hypothetical protein
LLYFPFEENKETLPIPLDIKGMSSDKDDIPLVLRRPGIEVFWNERLIPEAHLPFDG